MNNNFQITEDLLWDYADGFLSSEEKHQVEAFLGQHPEWQQRLQAIRGEQQALFNVPMEKPRADFADRVMASWATEMVHNHAKNKAKGRDWIIIAIAAVFGLFILTPIVVMVVAALQSSAPEVSNQITSVDWGTLATTPVVQYASYLGLTFLTLRFAEKWFTQRSVSLKATV
ncbi:MAG: hypothetical protein IT270_18920 [Saprospiraceae bacterium]|nr:hypothetical protein [Saprospiraceae bacterium]